MIGKLIRMTRDSRDVELHAALLNEGISLDKLNMVDAWVRREDYFDPEVAVASAYLTNEVYYFIQEGVPYQIIQPLVYGIDFYGDCLITSEKELSDHAGRVRAFREASLKGWEYAMAHPVEIISLIRKKYHSDKTPAHLRYEAETMRQLILPDLVEIGHMNPGRWEHIANTFSRFGWIPSDYSLDGLLYDPAPKPNLQRVWWIFRIVTALGILAALISIVMFVFNKRLGREVKERKLAEGAVRESESKHKAMIANISDVIAIMDMDGTIRFISPNVEKWFGWRSDQLIGKDAWEAIHPDDQGKVKGEYRSLLEVSRMRKTIEFRYRCQDRSYKYIELTAVNLIDDSNVGGILVNYHDITDRKQTEMALEKRIIALTRPIDDPGSIAFEEMFNLDEIQQIQDMFAEATGVASIITRIDGTPITRPSNFCRLCIDIIRNTDKGRRNCYHSDAVLGSRNPGVPIIQPCLSGGLWDAGSSITVGGQHIANWLIGQVRDDTQSDEKMLAYAREIGADEDAFMEAYRDVPQMSQKQFENVARALFTFAKQLSTTAYQNIQQSRFISERKRAEEEKERLRWQLNQAQKMEAIGTLAGGISHDFNNLLQVINGYTQILMMDAPEDSPEYSNYKAIERASDRAARLVQQLLLFSRKVDTERKPLDLNQEVEHARKLLERTIPKMIDIKLVTGSRLWTINADPVQMEQILLNLGTNAADAMPDGGRLTITTENAVCGGKNVHMDVTPGNYVRLTVSDTGQGMDKETVEHIFEPFYTTKEIGKGTGLGLASVYGIVKSHSGFISCYSDALQGTSFVVHLPALENVDIIGEEEGMSLPPPRGGTETVLIVDDESPIRDFASKSLTKYGYTTLTAASGEEALEVYFDATNRIGLVIIDIGMPGMGGYKCLGEILKKDPSAKILIASGYSINGQVKEALEHGAAGYVGKPYQLSTLLAKVRAILDD